MPEQRFARLDDGNYFEWEIYMEALVKKGFFGIVEGTETQPPGSPNSKAVLAFLKKQCEARSEISLRSLFRPP
ncbi:hypothetical protein NLJ89_g1566 [Agrocybe chaxingu]|uniref:Uncharacterized protein n=1 Tax=Agrocybe chaxingu TaxID=84603 RepID=A0A9W8MZU0_9AGAR|nr:hypothetical protein NLJ89_g1566 [Agrocybe chaxingu]